MSKFQGIFLSENDEVAYDIWEPMEDEAAIATISEQDEEEEEETSPEDEEAEETEDTGENEEEDALGGIGGDEEKNEDENLKLARLLRQYEQLYDLSLELSKTFSHVDISNFSDKEKAIFEEFQQELSGHIERIRHVIRKGFDTFGYKKLLTVYLYLKVGITTTAKTLDLLIES